MHRTRKWGEINLPNKLLPIVAESLTDFNHSNYFQIILLDLQKGHIIRFKIPQAHYVSIAQRLQLHVWNNTWIVLDLSEPHLIKDHNKTLIHEH